MAGHVAEQFCHSPVFYCLEDCGCTGKMGQIDLPRKVKTLRTIYVLFSLRAYDILKIFIFGP